MTLMSRAFTKDGNVVYTVLLARVTISQLSTVHIEKICNCLRIVPEQHRRRYHLLTSSLHALPSKPGKFESEVDQRQ
jgi:hypothetical protein